MGSTVSWLPQQPLCVSSISKQGQLVLQDVRLLGRPLLQQQLDGPVYDAVWMTPGISAGSSADGSAGSSAGVLQEQQLVVVGRDNCLRVYTLGAAALQQGRNAWGVALGCDAPVTASHKLLLINRSFAGAWGKTHLGYKTHHAPESPRCWAVLVGSRSRQYSQSSALILDSPPCSAPYVLQAFWHPQGLCAPLAATAAASWLWPQQQTGGS
jgi:hypothetical protein